MSINKKVIKMDVLERLAELFPDMTILNLLEFINYCEIIKKEMETIENRRY